MAVGGHSSEIGSRICESNDPGVVMTGDVSVAVGGDAGGWAGIRQVSLFFLNASVDFMCVSPFFLDA